MPSFSKHELIQLALLFTRLGVIGFGGPAAHIAIFENEIVRRRKWITHEELLDMIGAANLIPGPNSTEIAMHIGRLRAGLPGLIVAGTCFIAPAFLMVTALAWVYVRYGNLPQVASILYGVKPVVIAIVIQALWSLLRKALPTRLLAAVFIAALACNALGVNELIVLVGGGIIAGVAAEAALPRGHRFRQSLLILACSGLFLFLVLFVFPQLLEHSRGEFSRSSLFFYFLKIGSVLYGSGYVLLAFLQGDLVERLHWLTSTQLLDAIAVGQATPGPMFTSASFIGYLLSGWTGAVLATLAIFLPAYVLVALTGPLITRIRRTPVAGAFLGGVNAASVALMAVVAVELGRVAIVDAPTLVLARISHHLF